MTNAYISIIPDQAGRTVVVTGANSGLGLRSAEALAGRGARVLLACRDQGRAATALDAVRRAATGAEPEVVPLDLADLDSVRACAKEVAERVDQLDVLMNNAGVMAIPLRRTAQGFEAQFGTNHLGHFALTGLLLEPLLAAPAPRVVTTSSFMHHGGKMHWGDLQSERGYRTWSAYSQSKLANLLFAFELDRLAREHGTALVSVAAHPGYASTNLQSAGPRMANNRMMEGAFGVANKLFAQSDVGGASPQLHAATLPGVQGGEFWGPSKLFETRGRPKRGARASAAARRRDEARRLWALSEKVTRITYRWPNG